MRKEAWVVSALLVGALPAAQASLSFTPAAGWTVAEVWSGNDAAHFAMDDGDFYIYGAQSVGSGQYANVVRYYDGLTEVEIARSSDYDANTYFPDAITVVDGDVYWAHVPNFGASIGASVYKSQFDGSNWLTTTVLDASAGARVFSLSTDGDNVFGVGLSPAGENVAFYFDELDQYKVLAELPAIASGGSGFDPAGNFFAGAWGVDGDLDAHMYGFTAMQVANRLSEAQASPYAASDATRDLIVPSNSSAVMEADSRHLFGAEYDSTFTGTNPYAFDVDAGTSFALGTLSGATTTVAGDLYYRDGEVYFLGKNDWSTGSEATIYRLVPEPGAYGMFLLISVVLRRRQRTR